MLRPLLLLGCAAALCACANDDVPSASAAAFGQPASALAAAPAPSNLDYVALAGAADQFEIQLSRVALERSQNAGIRGFAQMMIDHHTASSNRIMAAARDAGLNPAPPALPADKAQIIASLRAAPAAGFDQAYIDTQLAAHQEALDIHRSYVGAGQSKLLRDAAAAIVPVVEQHVQYARTLSTAEGSGRREP